MEPHLVKKSRFLSLVLRHRPEEVGVELDPEGWIEVDVLLRAINRVRYGFTHECLREIVEQNDKQRFAFSPDGSRIRASQGHSVNIDLNLEPRTPPEFLYHGTAEHNLDSIRRRGLNRGGRNHVHLSPDETTAQKVGSRHGSPHVLQIRSGQMAADGFVFYLSDNGVWLTSEVPSKYIEPAQ